MKSLKTGEETTNFSIILEDGDPALNPANRPLLAEAIEMIIGIFQKLLLNKIIK